MVHLTRYNKDRKKNKGENIMKLLNSIYKFLLGDDTDVPFEGLDDEEIIAVDPDPEAPVLYLVSDCDAA